MDTDHTVAAIGARIRELRERRGLSLRELAELAGVSSSAIQKIEANSMIPTISVLMKIARGLRCRVTDFLDDDTEKGSLVVIRRAERRQLSWAGGAVKVDYMSGDIDAPEHIMIEVHVEPGGNSGKERLSHGGDEIVLCLSGQIEFVVQSTTVTLKRGDCMHFKSDLPHRWSNPGKTAARMLLVCSASGSINRLV